MKCKKCGADMPNDAIYCENCGTKLDENNITDSIDNNSKNISTNAIQEHNAETDVSGSKAKVLLKGIRLIDTMGLSTVLIATIFTNINQGTYYSDMEDSQIETEFKTVDCKLVGTWKESTLGITFNENGTGRTFNPGDYFTFVYKDLGTAVEILFDDDTVASTYEYYIDGDTLTIGNSQGYTVYKRLS